MVGISNNKTSYFFGRINLPVNTKLLAIIGGKVVATGEITLVEGKTMYNLEITGGFLDGVQISFKANNQVIGTSKFLSGQQTRVDLVFLTPNTIKR